MFGKNVAPLHHWKSSIQWLLKCFCEYCLKSHNLEAEVKRIITEHGNSNKDTYFPSCTGSFKAEASELFQHQTSSIWHW